MEPITILPSVNPERIPRVVHKELNVPVMKLQTIPQHMPKAPPTMAAGKAPRTHVPIGFTRPILCAPHAYVDRAYMG
jgi:hypothetical protein